MQRFKNITSPALTRVLLKRNTLFQHRWPTFSSQVSFLHTNKNSLLKYNTKHSCCNIKRQFHSAVVTRNEQENINEQEEEKPKKKYFSYINYDIGEGADPNKQRNEDMMAIIFTCSICKTRSCKQFSKNSYERGVVVVQCKECKNLHLVADHLGFFSDMKNVEEYLKAQGKEVTKVTEEMSISPEDLERLNLLKVVQKRKEQVVLNIQK